MRGGPTVSGRIQRANKDIYALSQPAEEPYTVHPGPRPSRVRLPQNLDMEYLSIVVVTTTIAFIQHIAVFPPEVINSSHTQARVEEGAPIRTG